MEEAGNRHVLSIICMRSLAYDFKIILQDLGLWLSLKVAGLEDRLVMSVSYIMKLNHLVGSWPMAELESSGAGGATGHLLLSSFAYKYKHRAGSWPVCELAWSAT